MGDALTPSPLPPVAPKKSSLSRFDLTTQLYQKTSPIDLTPGPYANDVEAAAAGVFVSQTYRLTSGGWARRQELGVAGPTPPPPPPPPPTPGPTYYTVDSTLISVDSSFTL